MYIEHVAMYVNELEKTREFLSSILDPFLMKDIITQGQSFIRIF